MEKDPKFLSMQEVLTKSPKLIKTQQIMGPCKAWFPLARSRIVKSCDSSRFWLTAEKLVTTENKNLTEVGSDLQPKEFLSQFLRNIHPVR